MIEIEEGRGERGEEKVLKGGRQESPELICGDSFPQETFGVEIPRRHPLGYSLWGKVLNKGRSRNPMSQISIFGIGL